VSNFVKELFAYIKRDVQSTIKDNSIHYDYFDTIDFYLTKEQKEYLKKVGLLTKFIIIPYWLLKVLFFKLTPTRRVLFVISFVLLTLKNSSENYSFLGIVILVFLLLLELKDKLIAKDELKAGRAVQTAFMPEQSPKIQGYDLFLFTQPANNVGGDMVDYIKIDDRTYGIAIADISGKELGAALHMVKLQAILRTVVSDYKSLSELGKKINKIFFRDSEKRRFASMLYLELSTEKDLIRFVNAGHFPPVLISGQSVYDFPKGKVALGVKRLAEYFEQSCSLKSGDILVLYSDGVTEAMNGKGEFYGYDKLVNVLLLNRDKSALQMGKAVLDNVNDFVGLTKMHDDLSLVIIKKS
jgi:serine phosphatase RsbU (regulator of sigma subunit)